MQVLDNTVDLAIAWNFERIIIGAYRWLSDNYQENDRIFLFGFSRGAYQVRALAGMIQRVGLIHKGNEEQIPFAYALYATHTEDLATRFKTTFSRENVTVHFVGVWDTVSSVGVIRGRNLPLTDSAEHVCFFRHALALDERRVKFLPEYVHGGVCQNPTAPEQSQIGLNSASARIKEVWFPGTHSDIGGGNQANLDLDLGGTPFLWMSFEAVSCGLRLRPTKVEWNLEHLHDVKESLTGVWKIFEWMPFKRLSYKDESSTNYRPHKGRGRKIKPGQKVHSSVAFCNESYQPRAILPARRRLSELVGKGSRSNREWVEGWEDLLEMDIFDLSLMSNVIETLKSGTAGGESPMWVYRLTAMTSTVEGLAALRGRPDIGNDLVQIFTSAGQRVEVQECVTAILEKVSKDQTSILLSSEHCLWLLRVARETAEMNRRSFAVKLLVNTLSQDQSYEHILNEQALGALDEMARDEQHPWLTDGAFAMFTTILSQNTLSQKLFAANTLAIVRRRFTAEDSRSQEVAKCLFKTILQSGESGYSFDVLYANKCS
ncbi:hypothetical protein M413DRAFT_285325 [Hebeloma cylindrosporum]|uniref:T6SS Phospholipase effector Tle1-like catalytic domain-containing protein n=1 Tax=Hebeloma cylindrosporum TaxID=76867 RepID=A0A0C2Y718_HEBCY|nr:hypothetical protein M413DRAFT_285325 [Hebeloma cylindrosporum h7]